MLRKRWRRGDLLAARVGGEPLFPLELPLKRPTAREVADDFGAVMRWVEALRQGSAQARGRGYGLCWQRTGNRVQGTNELPVAARLETDADAFFLLREEAAVRRFDVVAEQTLTRFPELAGWLTKRCLQALAHADDWSTILDVVDHFVRRPRPGVHLRQLDIPGVDTKFIESRRGLIGELLDTVLPEDAVDITATGAAKFLQRYGLKSEPALIRFRLLDAALHIHGLTDLSVPVEEFARLELPVAQIFITENRINGLAMPACADSLVILLPDARSLLMDRETLLAHRRLWVREPAEHRYLGQPDRLTPAEAELFEDLRHDRLGERVRLEQERIGYGFVERAVQSTRI
jgi:hypothetical protein